MDFNGSLASMQITYKPVINAQAHPPVTKTVTFEAGGTVKPVGEILAIDADGYAVSYDPDGESPVTTPVGVLAEPVDPTGSADVPAKMLWHGAAIRSRLTVGGSAPEATDLAALEGTGRVYVV